MTSTKPMTRCNFLTQGLIGYTHGLTRSTVAASQTAAKGSKLKSKGLTGFTALEGYFEVIGCILEVGNDILLLGNGWVMIWGCFGLFRFYNVELMFAASFDSKMGCLYSVFDAKKQGKPAWVVRTKNWKLREGENRLLGLLKGVSVSGNVFT
ncbi:hypothetical protein GQ457_03G021050 [Hibiscus cannabinus]